MKCCAVLCTLLAATHAASAFKDTYTCDLPGALPEVKSCDACIDGSESKTVIRVSDKTCIDRQVFSAEFWGYDLTAMVIWFLAAGLATSAGVGGGGIYVPLGMILVLFEYKAATGLSQASIFGASLGGLLLNMRNRHPTADRPLIDLDMALFLAPMELAGAVCGVLIQSTLPKWLTLLLMFVILGMTAFRTLKKGRETWKKEVKANREKKAKKAQADKDQEQKKHAALEEGNTILSSAPVEIEDVRKTAEGDLKDENAAKELAEVLSPKLEQAASQADASASDAAPRRQPEPTPDTTDGSEDAVDNNRDASPRSNDENKAVSVEDVDLSGVSPELIKQASKVKGPHHSADTWLAKDASRPSKKFGYLFIVWIVQIIFLFLKGSKKLESIVGVSTCSPEYWVLTVLSLLWLVGFALAMGRRAVSKSVRKAVVGFDFQQGDVRWTWKSFRFYSIWTFIAGIIAGLIGIGGGMVLGPLMLLMGLPSQVSTATTATMVVITSSAIAIGYVVAGIVPWTYFVLFFSVTFVGALVGKLKIDAVVKQKGLSSILIFVLGGIITFASLFAFILMFMDLGERSWVPNGPTNPCAA